jgi:small subunit ribosomal protein S18
MPNRRRPARPPRRRQLSAEESLRINYRDVDFLRQFLNERGRIRSRAATGLSRRDQSRLARAVKVARELALLPYTTEGGERRRDRGRR